MSGDASSLPDARAPRSGRRQPPALPSRLLVIADASHATGGGVDALPRLVERAAAAGARWFEVRRPAVPGRPETGRRVDEALACLEAARAGAADTVVLVNDRVDVALACGADGAHVGQDDLPAREARRLLGPDRWLGLSTHDAEQLDRGAAEPVDYLAIGPIFASRTKSGHAEVLGLDRARVLRERWGGRLVAIGGIDERGARELAGIGLDAVAVIGAIEANAVGDSVGRLLEVLGESPRRLRPVALAGFPGAGKSTLGPWLARAMGRPFADVDEAIEVARGCSVAEIIAADGVEAFRELEERAVAHALASWPRPPVIALGGGALDGSATREALERAGARLLWLDATLETCLARCKDGPRRPVLDAVRREAGRRGLAELHARRRAAARAAGCSLVDAERGLEGTRWRALRVARDQSGDSPC